MIDATARVRFEILLIALILLSSLLLRLYTIGAIGLAPYSDGAEYHDIALSLAREGTFATAERTTAYRPPGYPLFLAGVYGLLPENPLSGQLAQSFLSTLSVLLIYLIGKRVLSAAAGLLSAAIFATYTSDILLSNLLMPEPLYVSLLLAAILLFLSPGCRDLVRYPAIGVLLGCASLVKPFTLLLLVSLVVLLRPAGQGTVKTLRVLIVTAAVAVLVIAPWSIRNYRLWGSPDISYNWGVNLWIGNNPAATGGWRFPAAGNPLGDIEDERLRDETGTRLALEYVLSNPAGFVSLIPRKIAHLFASESPYAVHLWHRPHTPGGMSYASLYAETPAFLHFLVNLQYVAMVGLGIFGLVGLRRPRPAFFTLFTGILGVWVAFHLLFFGNHRFHHILMPFFALSAAAFFTGDAAPWTSWPLRWKITAVSSASLFVAILSAEILTGVAGG